jgi:hypothetical protein
VFWDSAQKVRWRFDAANQRLGDTGTQVVITNADGSETMEMLRLKVANAPSPRWKSSAAIRVISQPPGGRRNSGTRSAGGSPRCKAHRLGHEVVRPRRGWKNMPTGQ